MLKACKTFVISLQLLIWPLVCVGCGAYDKRLCTKCQTELDKDLTFAKITKDGDKNNALELFSVGRYQNVWRKVVLAWKDHGRRDFESIITLCLDKLLSSIEFAPQTNVVIVPLPSSKQSVKKRGFWQTLVLAKICLHYLREKGVSAQIKPLLRQRNIKKQVNFSAKERALNKTGSIYLAKKYHLRKIGQKEVKHAKSGRILGKSHVNSNAPKQLLLIDDICTTGATFGACTQILTASNYTVTHRICLAA